MILSLAVLGTPPFLYPFLELWKWHQHLHSQLLTVERVLIGVEKVANDDRAVHHDPAR